MRYRHCSGGNSEEAVYRQKRVHSSTLADLWELISPQHFDHMPTTRPNDFPDRDFWPEPLSEYRQSRSDGD